MIFTQLDACLEEGKVVELRMAYDVGSIREVLIMNSPVPLKASPEDLESYTITAGHGRTIEEAMIQACTNEERRREHSPPVGRPTFAGRPQPGSALDALLWNGFAFRVVRVGDQQLLCHLIKGTRHLSFDIKGSSLLDALLQVGQREVNVSVG